MFTLRFKVFVVLILVLAVVSFALIQAMGRDLDRARRLVEARSQNYSRVTLQENVNAYREPYLRDAIKLWLKQGGDQTDIESPFQESQWPAFILSVIELPGGAAEGSRVIMHRHGATSLKIPLSELGYARQALTASEVVVAGRVSFVPWPWKSPAESRPQAVLRMELSVAEPELPPFEILPSDLREIRESVTLTLLIGATLIIVVVIGLLRFLVLQPLDRLVKASKLVAGGNFTQLVAGGESRDEVGRLVVAFNTMQQEVRSYQKEVAAKIEAAKEEISNRERSLLVAKRLAATGTLAAGLAHEINNPLGAMQNAARRLKSRGNNDERAIEYLELIEEGLDRIRHLMSQILDFSRRRDAKPETFSLTNVLQTAAAFVQHRFDERHRLEVSIPSGLPQLYGDSTSLGQVFINLLMNARDALNPEGGEVRLFARFAGTREIEVVVSDSGQGMDDATVSHIFDPFFTTKEVGKGTGLGLSIVHTVIRNHDGIISVESQPGQGTTFTITLPIPSGTESDQPAAGDQETSEA